MSGLKIDFSVTMWYNIIVGIHPLTKPPNNVRYNNVVQTSPLTEGANNG